ncbi:MAG TPA: hypothetical protein VKS20_02465 [Candidatus Acidoferrales bacterium]|nr:hypothetical protein [Candidatus Acidoferrales bacterium]
MSTSTTTPAPISAILGILCGDFAAGAPEATGGGGEPAVAREVAAGELDAPALDAADAGMAVEIPAGAPHFVQNLVCAVRAAPHFVQKRCAATEFAGSLRGAPHLVQKASRSVSAAPH